MAPSGPAVTNRTPQGMTLRELIVFVGDALRAPIPVDQDAPLSAEVRLGSDRIRSLSAPLVPCTCPEWPGARLPLHHPSCAHRVPVSK